MSLLTIKSIVFVVTVTCKKVFRMKPVHLQDTLDLKDLVLIYDSNHITIEGDTSIAWSEDVEKRFEAQNWDVVKVNGHCYDEIEKVLDGAKTATKPTLIIANTIIGKGAGELEGNTPYTWCTSWRQNHC